MSRIRSAFENHEAIDRLGDRTAGFALCMDFLSLTENPVILETGTMRILDNWEGDGQSTRIWDWVKSQIPGTEIYSVDISEESCKLASKYCPNVKVTCSDSIPYLNSLSEELLKRVTILYLDSFDWSKENHVYSSFHHFAELAAVWRHLSKGCLIMVDDRHDDNNGKHFMIQTFMDSLGIRPRFIGYQIAWIKP